MNYNQPATLQAAILDWAGTVVDFGSFAPTQIFVEAFAEFGVQVSLEEARGPMGMGKWDHIRTLCDIPAIAERYRAVFGRLPSDDDVTAIYERFMPLQIEKIAEHSALIPGALQAIAELRGMGLKIGSCSGYPAVVMEKVVAMAVGLTYEQYKALPAAELERERTRIEQMFEGSRPHYLIETIAELPAVVRDINARLARGEMPQGN